VQLVKLAQGDTGLVTIALLAVGLVVSILICAYVAFSRKPSPIVSGRQVLRYDDRHRRWALAGLILIFIVTAGGIGYHFYRQYRPPDKIILLVADFDGPDPQKYRVSETVLTRLRAALEPYPDVRVEALGRAITEAEGSDAARAEGEKHKAAIVIWGWYGATAETVPLSVHFELLRPPKHMPELGSEAKGDVRTLSIAELEQFTLQTNLSAELAYVSLVTVGVARLAAEDWDGAIARLGDALAQGKESSGHLGQAIVYLYRGLAYSYGKGDYQRAIADYDQVINLDPGKAAPYTIRGLAYADAGEYAKAIADYDEAIRLDPKDAWAYSSRGLAYADKGDYEQAIADYDQAILLDPSDASAYSSRGRAYAEQGNYERSIADFDETIRLDPTDAVAYANRGLSYARQGEYERAIVDYDQAIRLDPKLAEAYNSRGVAYCQTGYYSHAISDYDQVIRLDPRHAAAYYNRGLA
jgi:tetratricopeptide (TPR) repeat protein